MKPKINFEINRNRINKKGIFIILMMISISFPYSITDSQNIIKCENSGLKYSLGINSKYYGKRILSSYRLRESKTDSVERITAIKENKLYGKRNKAETFQTIFENNSEIRRIYNKGLASNKNLCGKLELQFVIAASGKVVSITKLESTVRDTIFEKEIVRYLQNIKFSKLIFRVDTTTFIYPYSFSN